MSLALTFDHALEALRFQASHSLVTSVRAPEVEMSVNLPPSVTYISHFGEISLLRVNAASLDAARFSWVTSRRTVLAVSAGAAAAVGLIVWAECQIADETSSCTVTASYLSDPLRGMVLAATAALSGFRSDFCG